MGIFDELRGKFSEKKDIPNIVCMHCNKEFLTYDELNAHIPNCKFRKEAYKMISNFGDEVSSDIKKEEKFARQTSSPKKSLKRKLSRNTGKRKSSKKSKSKKLKRSSKKKAKSGSKRKVSSKKSSKRSSKKKSKRR